MRPTSEWPITISLPHGFTIGGVTTWALVTARHLAMRGRRVRLVVHPPLDGHVSFDPINALAGAEVDVIHAPALDRSAGFEACLKIYERLLPTILLPNLCPESYAIAAALSHHQGRDIRTIAWIHGDNSVDYAYLKYYSPIIHRYMAVSTRCRSAASSLLPDRADDIRFLPHGVEVPATIRSIRRDDDALRVVYAGRMEQGIKRVVDILAMSIVLAQRDIPVEIRLVGDGPHAHVIDCRLDSLNRRFAKQRFKIRRDSPMAPDAVNAVWQWADVCLIASRLEGCSVAMLEAMAHGCIPVVTEIPSGVNDVIENGRNGLTFPVGDIDAAVNHLARVQQRNQEAIMLAEAARSSIVRRFGIDDYIDRVLCELDHVTQLPPRTWLVPKSLSMPISAEESGAIPPEAECESYERVVQFIQSRPDATKILVYGLGVNGMTLAERLRADRRTNKMRFYGADDNIHAATFEALDLTPHRIDETVSWPDAFVAVVTPNRAHSMHNRLRRCGALYGYHYTSLHDDCNLHEESRLTEAVLR